jgi:hypothetical protein
MDKHTQPPLMGLPLGVSAALRHYLQAGQIVADMLRTPVEVSLPLLPDLGAALFAEAMADDRACPACPWDQHPRASSDD